jgi:hypothetical protein
MDIAARIEQRTHDFEVPGTSGEVERQGVVSFISCIRVRASLEQ